MKFLNQKCSVSVSTSIAPGSTSVVSSLLKSHTAGLIPEGLQLRAQMNLESLDRSHKSGWCAESCARRWACFWIKATKVPVFLCLRNSCTHVTEVNGPSDLWNSRWRLLCKVTGTFCYKWTVSFPTLRSTWFTVAWSVQLTNGMPLVYYISTELLTRCPFKYTFRMKRFFRKHVVLAVPILFLYDSSQSAKGLG